MRLFAKLLSRLARSRQLLGNLLPLVLRFSERKQKMIWKCLLLALAFLAVGPLSAQQSLNGSLAYARLIAAHKLPTVIHGQCSSAHGDWLERDKADKQGGPYWFQKVSTEELARMASLSTACATEGIEGHAASNATAVSAFVARSSEFREVLLDRAETVLHDHALINDYLLQP